MNAPFIMPHGGAAVMAQRGTPRTARDFFPTPPWATRALFAHVLPELGWCDGVMPLGVVQEPCAGEGHMSEVIAEYTDGVPVIASDLYNYRIPGIKYGHDFLSPRRPIILDPDWVMTNPPFAQALDMTLLSLDRARVGVAMLLRTQWLEGIGRYERLFSLRPPTLFAPFVERVPMIKRRWNPKARTMTAYAWFVWLKGAAPRAPLWIPPGCCARLTRASDLKRFTAAGRRRVRKRRR